MTSERVRKPRTRPAQDVRLRDIALRSGVGVITVSRAINHPGTVAEATRARILRAIDELGFIPNQVAGNLARAKARIVGTVVPPLINSGIAEQVQGMSDMLGERGMQLLIAQGEFTPESEEALIRSLLGWRPAGLILQAYVQSGKAREAILAREMPVIEISEVDGGPPIGAAVGVSNFAAAYAMTRHLLARGYERVGCISTPAHGNDRQSRRRLGYIRAVEEANGIPIEVEMPMTSAHGAAGLRALVAREPRLDAVFCASDTLAIGAIQECHRLRWPIPARIAIAGYGDLELAEQLFPSLTTVRIRRREMGRVAAGMLLAIVNDGADRCEVRDMGFEIMARESA
jgi:LacI family gluconate utilization system Gnt-I transcriptional repressor